MVCWESSRQPFICHSTAESELISYSEGHQLGEALAELLKAVGNPVHCLLYGDNVAAIASVNNETGSWRTRHLRLRACCLRDAVNREGSTWAIRWLAGSCLIADGGTKPLQGDSFLQFRAKLRVGTSSGVSSKVALQAVGSVSPSFDFTKCRSILLGCVALIAAGQWSLAGVLAIAVVGILKWMVGTRPETKEAQGPEPRPQQERNKKEEGSASNENPQGLDRSGTVTPKDSCPAQQVFGDINLSEAMASLRMMRANEHELGDRAQLPVRPRRRLQEPTAAARGAAASGRTVILGGRSVVGEDGLGSGEGTTTVAASMPQLQRSERTGAMMRSFPLLSQPVRDPPGQIRVVTRLPSQQDPRNTVAVWDPETPICLI